MLIEIIGFSFDGDLNERVEAFERTLERYTAMTGGEIAEDVKVGVVVKQLPRGPLKDHLVLNMEKFDTWSKVKNEIDVVRRAMLTSSGYSTAWWTPFRWSSSS